MAVTGINSEDRLVQATFAAHLKDLGFADIKHVTERLRAWSGGQLPALRSDRARGLLARLTPYLLAALAAVTEGASLEANLAAVRGNVRLGAEIAIAFSSDAERVPDGLDLDEK